MKVSASLRIVEDMWYGRNHSVLTLKTTEHHLVVADFVGRNENYLSPPALPGIPQKLHAIRSAAALLGVPEDHPLWLDVVVNQACNGRAEGSLLIGANPDEKPSYVRKESQQLRPKRINESGTYQLGLWMQVDSAAPMPVPVQTRMPLLNMAEAWPTPATKRIQLEYERRS